MGERKSHKYYICDNKEAKETYKVEKMNGDEYDLLPEAHKEWFKESKQHWIYDNIAPINWQTAGGVIPDSSATDSISIEELEFELAMADNQGSLLFNNYGPSPRNPGDRRFLPRLIAGNSIQLYLITLNGRYWSLADIENWVMNTQIQNIAQVAPAPEENIVAINGGFQWLDTDPTWTITTNHIEI